MTDHSRWFPRCLHDYPGDDLTYTPITERQRAECAEDAGIIDAKLDPGASFMGEQTDDEVRFRGYLGEQVFANVCGVLRKRVQPIERCLRCFKTHGPAGFPTWLDVKVKGSVDPIELVVNKRVPRCLERFAMVEVHHSREHGCVWIVAPVWRIKMGEDVKRGRYRFNSRAENWMLDAWALRRELESYSPRDCMICGPEWSTKGIQKNAVEAIADMRRMLDKRGGKV